MVLQPSCVDGKERSTGICKAVGIDLRSETVFTKILQYLQGVCVVLPVFSRTTCVPYYMYSYLLPSKVQHVVCSMYVVCSMSCIYM